MTIPRSRVLDKRYYGVVEALVIKVVDDPAKEGRIKIKFPWFDNQTITEWCRVKQLYAGDGFGTFFIPEEGMEVLVAFIHGDMRKPIILGGLYNGKDKPSTHRTADRDHKLIRTKAGHQVLFDDSNGKQKVQVTSNKQHQVELSDADQKVTITTSNGNKAIFDDAANTITVTTSGGDQIVLDGNGKSISLTSTTVKVTATEVDLSAGTVNLGTGASQKVILGDTFLTFFNTHVHGTAVGPTTPPQPTVPPVAVLSLTTKVG